MGRGFCTGQIRMLDRYRGECAVVGGRSSGFTISLELDEVFNLRDALVA